ncbi:PREDICTED: uncharacterized protein LOC105449129 [Wasmannia auropunctata]|uniref:uncharacterized protein LOC105449129 n=1 Tax=Wasmannia auropunctata TaxID=64793 RepID=UPI0005EF91CB|nr:PREDICTED: uncharacterized protein LOC105449129 [Wasmannia auropunctata]
MWPEQFNTLLFMVRPFLLKRSRRQPLPVKLKLAATLAYLAHGDSVKSKAWEFRIGKSTMYKIIIEVCQAIWTRRNYCPSTYVDHDNENGDIIPGAWRIEENQRGLQRIKRTGSNNPARKAAQFRDTLCDYFISEAGEEAAPWQYEQAFRGSF